MAESNIPMSIAPPIDYSAKAAFFRTGLLLGLLPGTEVTVWAETVLAEDANAPASFAEIGSIQSDDITALRHALLDLCTEQVSEPVRRAILRLIDRDLQANKRSAGDTVTVLSQFRRFVKLDRETAEQVLWFENEAASGKTEVAVETFEARLRAWLERFRGVKG
jgi:hypothetical protein